MKSQFFVLLTLVALAVAPMPAAAQSADQTATPADPLNSTVDATPKPTPTPTPDPNPTATATATSTPTPEPDDGSSVSVPVDVGDSNSSEQQCTEHIDDSLAICSADLQGDTVVLDLYASDAQRIVLTEAMTKTGELSRESAFLSEGRNKVEFKLTQYTGSGDVGVTIDTGDVLYGKVIKEQSALIGGPWGPSDAQAAGLGGALSVSLTTFWLVLRRLRGKDTNAERVA